MKRPLPKKDFDLIGTTVEPFHVGARTKSAALIAWFLECVFRFDPVDVEDFICDGGGDKGIDAVAIDDVAEEIILVQSKFREARQKLQGERELQQFRGAAAYFESRESLQRLMRSRINRDLKRLLQRTHTRSPESVGGYPVKLVYITNTALAKDASDFVGAVSKSECPIEVWDLKRLAPVAVNTSGPDIQKAKHSLRTKSAPMVVTLAGKCRMAIAFVRATELVKLPGIVDDSIFSQNVRFSLGRTKINRELSKTLSDQDEHGVFAAYHNGLTILTEEFSTGKYSISVNGAAVVNGCQSLKALFDNRDKLTNKLFVIVKVVQLGGDRTLVERITYRTNNQNPINMRDQRSNDRIQRELQRLVSEELGDALFFAVKRGESLPKNIPVLDNQLAAQLILAVYLGGPWAAIRKLRLFDEDYHRIFSRRVTPYKLLLLKILYELAEEMRPELPKELQSSFSSVRFTIVYLIAKAVGMSEQGEKLLSSPEYWLPQGETDVKDALRELADEVLVTVKYHIESEREEEDENNPFDPKVVFKSKIGVQGVEKSLSRDLRRSMRKDNDILFSMPPSAS